MYVSWGSMENECLLHPFCCLCCEVGNISTSKHVQKRLGKGTKIERQMWLMNTCNGCVIADQIEQFFIKRRCASQAGNGYAKIILRQRKRWVWGPMLQKRWFFYLKISWSPTNAQPEAVRQGPTPETESPGRYHVASEPQVVKGAAPMLLNVLKVWLQRCNLWMFTSYSRLELNVQVDKWLRYFSTWQVKRLNYKSSNLLL